MQPPEPPRVDRRKAERTDDIIRAVIVAVRDEVTSQLMPEELHREHHALIAAMLDEMKRKRERHEKIKAQVGGWLIISILSGIGTVTYQGFLLAKEHWPWK